MEARSMASYLAGGYAAHPESLTKAVALLHDLQATLCDAMDRTVGAASANGARDQHNVLNEGSYVELCRLTRGIHEQLDMAKAEWQWNRGREYDDGCVGRDATNDAIAEDALQRGWSVRRVRRVERVRGANVVRNEYTLHSQNNPSSLPSMLGQALVPMVS